MSEGRDAKLIKVRLHNQGEDVETPWAEDLGHAPGTVGGRLVKLKNVPFYFAKPTIDDVIVARPDSDGVLAWDAEGRDYDSIVDSLVEDSGRWALIIDYSVRDPEVDVTTAFRMFEAAGESADIVVEGLRGPRPGQPGRAYLAAPAALSVADVLEHLRRAELPLTLVLEHPIDEDA